MGSPQENLPAYPDWPVPAAELERARHFLASVPPTATVALACHGDADGLSSCAIAVRALAGRTSGKVVPLPAGPGEHAHSDTMRTKIRETGAAALLVFDMGSRGTAIIPQLPTLVIDHHVPDGAPDGAVLINAHEADPEISTSLLTRALFRGEEDDGKADWLALIGAVGDLGADRSWLRPLLRPWGKTNLTSAAAIVNAARRSSAHRPEAALAALLEADTPRDIVSGATPAARKLHAMRDEVRRETERCSKTAPRFSGKTALIEFSSPCLVHSLVATRWARRLTKQIVIAANLNYTKGHVHFSVRSQAEADLRAWLRERGEGIDSNNFAQGHPRATGGILTHGQYQRLRRNLGFGAPH